MNEYDIMTPQRKNAGGWYRRAHSDFKLKLLERYGGYTEMPPVQGAWRDEKTGKVYQDTMICYRVASNNIAQHEIAALAILAKAYFPDQLAFYISHTGKASIVETV